MPSDKITPAIRRSVSIRAKNYCEYCRSPGDFALKSFTVDHVIPRAAGGETRLDNLAWACVGCNSYKHAKTHDVDPETNEEVALFNPRQQVWTEHFSWAVSPGSAIRTSPETPSDNFTYVIGKTPCGRASVQSLRLNRTGVVNLRRLLVMAGIHPPSES